jgi:hypothetical protein
MWGTDRVLDHSEGQKDADDREENSHHPARHSRRARTALCELPERRGLPKMKARTPQKRHNFSFSMDLDIGRAEFDELFVENASVHIERMDEAAFFIGIDAKGFPGLLVNTGIQGGKWYFNVQEDVNAGRFISVHRKARFKSERISQNDRTPRNSRGTLPSARHRNRA